MSSSVFYKFKSQKEPTRVEFDGTGISVFELKREIIVKSGLGDGSDFDLSIFDEDGKDEHEDDTEIIPRSTTVIARRLPALKRGHGKAARYMTDKIPRHAKNQSRKEQTSKAVSKPSVAPSPMDQNMTEEERMKAMFAAQADNWTNQKEELSKATRVQVGGPRKGVAAPDHEPPDGYVCYRCGNKGHWIQNCPTNDDPDFEGKRRFKRATGIPKSFMKTIEKPETVIGEDGEEVPLPSNVMLTADGDHVMIMADTAAWEKFQAKSKTSAAVQEAAAANSKELQERGLECSIDKKLFAVPMKTSCCGKTYCNDCITNALIESDFTCPNCQEQSLIDDLVEDTETAKKIAAYEDEKIAVKKEKERSKSPTVVKQEVQVVAEIKKKSPTPQPASVPTQSKVATSLPQPLTATLATKAASKSPQSHKSTPNLESVQPAKKRPAGELLENPKIPKGPKAMQQKQQQQQQQPQQNMMNNMNNMNNMAGFPNMPFNNMQPNFFPPNNFGMQNPMMPFPMGGMPNNMMNNPFMMGGGYGGMPMNGMNGMNGMNMFGGPQNNFGNGMGDMGIMNNGMGMGNSNGQFANQQKNGFNEATPSQEDNAYFRQPVNPHRHQGRQRKARPSDYREL